MNEPIVSVIIVSAGESQRMAGLDKIFTPILDKPVTVSYTHLTLPTILLV